MTTFVRDRLPAIRDLCRQYGVEELDVFGSALREDFAQGSDVDFLVTFRNDDYGPFLEKLADLEQALSDLLQRPVDLATRPSVEQSENPIRRDHILSNRQTLYVER